MLFSGFPSKFQEQRLDKGRSVGFQDLVAFFGINFSASLMCRRLVLDLLLTNMIKVNISEPSQVNKLSASFLTPILQISQGWAHRLYLLELKMDRVRCWYPGFGCVLFEINFNICP